jgi:uncharacterized protein (TIGR00251 family)
MQMEETRLRIKVIPRGKHNEIVGLREDELTIRLTAPPVEGAANEALLKFLAEAVGVRKPDLRIATGERSRHKVVAFRGLSAEELRRRLLPR